jgi:adenylate kinase
LFIHSGCEGVIENKYLKGLPEVLNEILSQDNIISLNKDYERITRDFIDSVKCAIKDKEDLEFL